MDESQQPDGGSAAVIRRRFADAETRALIVVGVGDDETLGASIPLLRWRRVRVLHVTDGAPRGAPAGAAAPPGDEQVREQAGRRRAELRAAMALAGIGPDRLGALEIPDQEAALAMVTLGRELAARFCALRPEVVVTHAYEGGHPDHDATAFAVRAAADLMARRGDVPPLVLEMSLYRARPGAADPLQPTVQQLLPAAGPAAPVVTLELSDEERRRKLAMLGCFTSQAGIFGWFLPFAAERFRQAPDYDFSRPPHAGTLQYEAWRFPLTGARWRELAVEAQAELRR